MKGATGFTAADAGNFALEREREQRKATLPWANRVATAYGTDSLNRVDRDPCAKCGTRRDVGCKHHPRPA